jgi:hypothetical protein
MNEIRYIAGSLLVLFGAYIAVMNWACVYASAQNKRKGIDKHHSMLHFVSVFPIILAYFTLPSESKAWIFLIPLLDIGNLSLIIGLPIALLRNHKET